MCRSYPSLAVALFLVLGVKAQRPTATFISESLVRLDLDGIRVFADVATDPAAAGIGVDDVVLFATEPASPPAGGRTFMPSMTGELLERRTERLGEKTAIYVHPVVTPIGEAPHYSYLVQWNGRRIYFTGETTDTKELLALTDLDLVFATPGIVAEVAKAGKEIGGRMVVIYHNTDKLAEVSVPCYRCKVMAPAVGETIQLFR